MANLRRHASRRASALFKKASNGMDLFLIHGLPGERKSGTPLSVDMPAPVKPAIIFASANRERRSAEESGGTFMRIVVMNHILGGERMGKDRIPTRPPPSAVSADVVWMKSVWHLPRDEAPLCS